MAEETDKDQEPLYQQQLRKVNGLLHELETSLNDEQHELLTRLFTERAVLLAMKQQAKAQETAPIGTEQ